MPNDRVVAVSRWWRVIGGLLMNLALGSLYAWSVFVAPLEKEFGWKRADTSQVFTWAVVVFAISFIIAGRLQDRKGPFLVSLTGCILLTIGFLLSARTTSLTYLIVCFGIIVGIGNGFGYATPIPVMAKWFPDKRGLAVGLAVAGYGGGSAIFGPLANLYLIPKYGWRTTFVVLGIVFFLMTFIGALLLKNPPVGYRPLGWTGSVGRPAGAERPGPAATTAYGFRPEEMLRTPTFYFMWISYALGVAAGLMVISQLVPFAKSMNIPGAALQTVTLVVGAAGNASGRILSGWMSDAVGRLSTLRLVSAISAVGMVLLYLTGRNAAALYVMVFIVYYFYGTQLSVYASATSDFFGTQNAGINYGLLFTAWGVAGIIGPQIGGKLLDKYQNYQAAFYSAGVLVMVAVGVLAIVARMWELLQKQPVPALAGPGGYVSMVGLPLKREELGAYEAMLEVPSEVGAYVRDRRPGALETLTALEVSSDQAITARANTEFTIFYATDRRRTSSSDPENVYGSDRGDSLEFGQCKVSIPTDPSVRQIGRLTAPSVLRFEFKADLTKHVVLLSVDPQSRETFLTDLRTSVGLSPRREAFVFIHGYNETFARAARRTAQLAYDLQFEGAPILYSWPSRGCLWRYWADEATIEWTKDHLNKFLAALADHSSAETIHIIAHSMGSRALAQTVTGLLSDRGRPPAFRQLVLAAPDIDTDVFLQLAAQISGAASRVTLYASSRDRALWISKLFHFYPRAGQSGEQIVVVDGIDTIDASTVDTSLVGHSYFADNRSILADIYNLVVNGHPPNRRFGLREKLKRGKAYWVYRP